MNNAKKTLSPPQSWSGQIDDILKEKLDKAYHTHTSTAVLPEIIKIAQEHSPIDLAYAACQLPAGLRFTLYHHLPDLTAKATFLINTDPGTRVAVFRHMSDREVKELIEHMPPDDAVAVLEAFPESRFRRVLDMVEIKKRRRIREIKQHRRNTAGRLMTNELFAFSLDTTIHEASITIRDHPGIDVSRQVFVLNRQGQLEGYVPERSLIINSGDVPLHAIMTPVVHAVSPEASREEVVDVVERYKLPALPVVDANRHLVGMITSEDVLEALEDIADETLAQIAGTGETVSAYQPSWKRVLARAPWLVATLCAGFLNVALMSSIQEYQNGVLTFVLFFVPLITGLSGNIGIQCSTVLVRSMATGTFSLGSRKEAILKEVTTGVTSGLLFGCLAGIIVWSLDLAGVADLALSPAHVGLTVGLGLWGACLASTFLGVFSPLFFVRIGVDPAIAAGPIVTAFNDFLSISIYFIIAFGLNTLVG